MAVYKLESSIEDCEIKPVPQLQILEYIFRKLKWYEGFRLLEQLHNLHQESDIGFKIEQIIQRIYDPNWSGGISRLVGDVPPGVWNLIEEEHTEQE